MNSAIRQVLMQLALEGSTVTVGEFMQWKADAGLDSEFTFQGKFTNISKGYHTINQAGLDFIKGDRDETNP